MSINLSLSVSNTIKYIYNPSLPGTSSLLLILEAVLKDLYFTSLLLVLFFSWQNPETLP